MVEYNIERETSAHYMKLREALNVGGVVETLVTKPMKHLNMRKCRGTNEASIDSILQKEPMG